ncbi:MAG: hypothetical protein ACREQJ_15515 [Candidatus Binatia bacterium]
MAIFLHELVRTVGARTDSYLDSVAEHQGRSAAKTGRRDTLVGVFRALEVSGETPQGVNLWRWGGWEDAAAILGRQFEPQTQDPALKSWWLGNLDLRRGGFDRLLESASGSTDVAELRARGIAAEIFLHEIVALEPNEREGYLGALGDEGAAAFASAGATLVGAYRSVFRDDEAVSLVAFPSVAALAGWAVTWHGERGDAVGRWRARAAAGVRARQTLVLRARHFLTSPWHT